MRLAVLTLWSGGTPCGSRLPEGTFELATCKFTHPGAWTHGRRVRLGALCSPRPADRRFSSCAR